MTSFQPPRATRIEHIAVDDRPRCTACGKILDGARSAASLCRDHHLERRLTQSHSISLTLEEIAECLASFKEKPATARELAPWPVRGKSRAAAA